MNRFNSSQPVGEIVSIMPQASEIFKNIKLTFAVVVIDHFQMYSLN